MIRDLASRGAWMIAAATAFLSSSCAAQEPRRGGEQPQTIVVMTSSRSALPSKASDGGNETRTLAIGTSTHSQGLVVITSEEIYARFSALEKALGDRIAALEARIALLENNANR